MCSVGLKSNNNGTTAPAMSIGPRVKEGVSKINGRLLLDW